MHPIRSLIWKQSPFLRILICWIPGIIIADLFRLPIYVSFILLCVFLFFALGIKWFNPWYRWKLRWLNSLSFVGILTCLAILIFQFRDIRNKENWLGKYVCAEKLTLQVRWEGPWEKKQWGWKNTASCRLITENGIWKDVSGKIQVSWNVKHGIPAGNWGDVFLIHANIKPIAPPSNPGSFDYARYIARYGIYHQTSLDSSRVVFLAHEKPSFIASKIIRWRDDCLAVLSKYLTRNDGVLGIAEALLIGYKNDLDREWMEVYQQTGIVHIIAISGMHLGLIYWVLGWIFSKIRFFSKKIWLKTLIIMLLIWIFTGITGASASILRSAVMFTILLLGKALERNSHLANTLAASACLLLMWDPMLLWDTGFQLSYAAIVGIVWLQPLFKWKTMDRWMVTKWLMDALSITLAAQLTTLPITLYLFHQFPTYFLISNLIAIPWSTALLFGEIFLLICSPMETLAEWVGKMVAHNIRWMNQTMGWIEQWPYANISDIPFDLYAMLFLFIIIIGWTSLKLFGAVRMGWLIIFGTLGWMGWYAFIQHRTEHQQKIVIYKISGATVIDLISGNHSTVMIDTGFKKINTASIKRVLKDSHLFHGVHQSNIQQEQAESLTHYTFCGKSILHVKHHFPTEPNSLFTDSDLMIISHTPAGSLKKMLDALHPKQVVFTADNKLWKTDQWKKELEGLTLRYYFIQDKGAFELSL